jgi:hypothetical protein
MREAATAWTRVFGGETPRLFKVTGNSLAKRGILTAVEGSYGHTRYAHRDTPQVPVGGDEADTSAIVLLALVEVHADALAASCVDAANVRTTDVVTNLRRAGYDATSSHVASVLRRLSHNGGKWHANRPARVIHTEGRSAAGRVHHLWRPATAAAPPAIDASRPKGKADAGIGAARIVSSLLGRPAAATEIAAWALAHRDLDPVAGALDVKHLRSALAQGGHMSDASDGEVLVIVRNRGALTCHGGAPVRYGVQTHEDARAKIALSGTDACRAADAFYAYRPAQELDALARLETEAREHDCQPVLAFASMRRQLLADRMCAELDAMSLLRGTRHLRQSLGLLSSWIACAPGPSREQIQRRASAVERMQEHCDAVLGAKLPSLQRDAPMLACVGSSTLSATEVNSLFVQANLKRGGSGPTGQVATVFEHVRRFPSADHKARRLRFKQPARLSMLDRADALVVLREVAGVPTALALLGPATDLLGYVLRDVSALRALLQELRPGDFLFRRAAVVALGLVGATVSPEIGIADSRDELDVQAYLLGASLVGRTEGIAAADAGYRLVRSRVAREAADSALARLESGDVVGVIG